MESTVKNPLVIRCEYCGGDQSYDIVKEKYVCAHCGAEANAAQKKAEYHRWKSLRHTVVMNDIASVRTFSCPSCGAQTMVSGEDASARCPFCQNTMIDAKFAGNDLPEVIIPFKISKEEAENKLRGWLKRHKNNPAAQLIEKDMQRFTACYLPYHIVRGGYNSEIAINMHDGTSSCYPFRAYLSHTAVNASKDMDNLFLDGIEPFDFEEAREFDFGFLNHQNAKIQNVDNNKLRGRISEETKDELHKSLARKIHTKEFSVQLDEDENESIPALMPVYLVKSSGYIAAAVNGQTGKVSISTGKEKNLTALWWLMPAIATLVVGIVAYYFGDIQLALTGAAVFAAIFFAIAHNRHQKKIVKEVITVPKTDKGHNDTRAVFFADFGKGPVPAEIKFFTPWRIIKFVIGILAFIFLPVLLAIPIQFLMGKPISDIPIGYGAAWYCIPGFMAIVFAGGLAKSMMYGLPLYYEILPNGKKARRKMKGKGAFSLKDFISDMFPGSGSKIGCFLIGFFVFLLIGSLGAMLS